MSKIKILSMLLLAFSTLVTACGSIIPTKANKPLSAGFLFKSEYLDFRSPQSQGWYLLKSSSERMEFAKSGVESNESFAAQVFIFSLAATKSQKEFESLIMAGIKNDFNPARFKTLEFKSNYSEARGYPCVNIASVVIDKQAKISATDKAELLLEVYGLYCRHPKQEKSGFSLVYSHRGKSLYPQLEADSNIFINSAQVPGY